jgi:hypothetical protein
MTAIYPDVASGICEVFSTKLRRSFCRAAQVTVTLRTWGLQLRERIGFKRAAVAVARKLAVIMHTML